MTLVSGEPKLSQNDCENSIGNSGAKRIADCVRSNTKLVKIALVANRIGTKGAEALLIAPLVRSISEIIWLDWEDWDFFPTF